MEITENKKIKIELLPHTSFLKYNGKFDKENAIEYSAKLAGECYEPDGWAKLKLEPDEKSLKRAKFTLGLEHSTPYEHIIVGMEITNVSKILAMVLNNERQCTTSEKSARYTKIDPSVDPNISDLEGELYLKWMDIFANKIKQEYGNIHNDIKIKKLAQENARYLVSVFSSTKMIHSIPWIQLNRVVSFMKKYMEKENKTSFDKRLICEFNDFISCLEDLNLLDDMAMSNRKGRDLSLFAKKPIDSYFGTTYSTNYKGTFAQLAQAHRHRTIEYSIQLLENKEYFIPPILKNDENLVKEWLDDINSVSYATPQGELISINECGTYEKFILKTKERLCGAAQQEIAHQTKQVLEDYKTGLKKSNHPLYEDIVKYSKGARCTFPDYNCASDCKFNEAKLLTRRV